MPIHLMPADCAGVGIGGITQQRIQKRAAIGRPPTKASFAGNLKRCPFAGFGFEYVQRAHFVAASAETKGEECTIGAWIPPVQGNQTIFAECVGIDENSGRVSLSSDKENALVLILFTDRVEQQSVACFGCTNGWDRHQVLKLFNKLRMTRELTQYFLSVGVLGVGPSLDFRTLGFQRFKPPVGIDVCLTMQSFFDVFALSRWRICYGMSQ